MADQVDKLLDHDYDGIRELDNKLPPWWLNLFYVTIIWGVGYIFYYHILGIGDLSYAEYQKSIDPNWQETTDPTYRPMRMAKGYHSPFYTGGKEITPKMLAEADQILQVGSYILTLHGTNPPNAKEPQGKKVSGE